MAANMEHIAYPSGARKRKCNPESWRRNINKRARQSGKAYVPNPKRDYAVKAREVGPPCRCTMKCYNVVGEEVIAMIHNDFWSLEDFTLQTAFIQKCAIETAVKKHYTADVKKQHNVRRTYHVLVDGKLVPICRTALGNILGVGNSRVFRTVKKKTAAGAIIPDMRGRSRHSSVG